MNEAGSETLLERSDAEDSSKSARYWQIALERSGSEEKTWRERGKKVVQRYRGQKEMTSIDGSSRAPRQMNILWSNTETLKGALYARMAKPDVRRRWPDKAPISSAISQVIERSLEYLQDRFDEQSTIEAVVEDYLLPGRGVAWVVYDPVMVDVDGQQVVGDQRLYEEYVFWEDYREGNALKWADMPWVARRHRLTRQELRDHPVLGPMSEKIPLNWEPKEASNEEGEALRKAEVWEIWDKEKRQRVWVSKDMPEKIATEDDPYRLEGFFPVPEPMLSVATNESRVPVPEFTIYQHQADELDRITERLAKLTEALKRRGVYDASVAELSKLASAGDNEFIPSENFQTLASKGGLQTVFQTEDISTIAQVVLGLYQQRAQLIQTIYEITGISDVIRGATDPNETATAQRLKGQFGSMRLKKRQDRVQRFIREIYRIKAEIIAENFDVRTMQEMTGVQLPTMQQKQQAQMVLVQAQQMQAMRKEAINPAQAQALQQAIPQAQEAMKKPAWEEIQQVMTDDRLRSYRIDIETDSTVFEDEQAEKQARNEFLQVVGGYLTQMLPVAQASPSLARFGLEGVAFLARAYKGGRQLEGVLEEAVEGAIKELTAAQKANPAEEAKAKAEMAKSQATIEKAKADTAKAGADVQKVALDKEHAAHQHQFDMATFQAEMQQMALENQKLMLEVQKMREEMVRDRDVYAMKMEEMMVDVMNRVGPQNAVN